MHGLGLVATYGAYQWLLMHVGMRTHALHGTPDTFAYKLINEILFYDVVSSFEAM
jgi:hypothetical protein